MPTKERRLREKAEKDAADRMELIFANVPPHVRSGRDGLDVTEAMLAGLDEALAENPHFKLRGGLLVPTGDGNIGYAAKKMGDKTRVLAFRKSTAEDLRSRYMSIWGKRGSAKVVALTEGDLSVRTVQKYMKDFPAED
jgi:hypothetical protein